MKQLLKPVDSVVTNHPQSVGGINTTFYTHEWYVKDLFAELYRNLKVSEDDGEYLVTDAEGNIGVGSSVEEAKEDYIRFNQFKTILAYDANGKPILRREYIGECRFQSHNRYATGEIYNSKDFHVIKGDSNSIRDWWHKWEEVYWSDWEERKNRHLGIL